MDTQLIQKVMAIVERDLRRRILPDLTSPSSRLQIDYMIRLLQWVAAQVGDFDTLDAAHQAAVQSLLESDEVTRLPAPPKAFYENEPVPSVAAQLRRLAASSHACAASFDRYVEMETALVRALDAQGGRGFSELYQGGKLTGAEGKALPVCDADTLSAYLKIRFAAPDAAATDVTPLPGGFGKDTVLFTIHGCGEMDGAAVIRKDFAVSAGPLPVTHEFPLLSALHRLGFPVAQPLWSEPDDTIISGPFIVSRRVAGTSAASDWQDLPEVRRDFVDQFARLLAQLHALSPATLFGASDMGMRTAVQGHMKLYYNHYRARARQVSGRLEASFAWLAANLPATDDGAARMVHGDVGFHNILMHEGRIEALLDWEFAHFGDPAEDIGYCWQFIDKLVSWDAFMAMYIGHGGAPISYRRASYYRVWGDVRNAVMGVGALGTVDLTDEADIRSPSSALAFGPLLELQALVGASQWNGLDDNLAIAAQAYVA